MNNYYHNFLSSKSGARSDPALYQQAISLPGSSTSSPSVSEPLTMGSSHSPVGYAGYSEQTIDYHPPKNSRHRRKSAPGSDHVKHRRTRSGCFTCRSRRVKCDEARPTCDRCRKGKRDCVYPDLSTSTKPSSTQDVKSAGAGDDEDDTDDSGLTPIPDEEYELSGDTSYQNPSIQTQRGLRRTNTASSLSLKRVITGNRQSSETPSLDEYQSPSPMVSKSASVASTPISASIPEFLVTTEPDWSYLPVDVRVALDYFRQHITYWDYGVHKDFHGFFQTTLLNIALRHEALLNAIVSFSLYQRALNAPDGSMGGFLKYYTHAVSLLLGNLKKPESRANLATLLTIFQLATIEEYLGDWVNLVGHQKAALEILTTIFTTESIIQTPIGRILLLWYLRFSLLVADLAGSEATLPQDWIENFVLQSQSQLLLEPQSLEWTCEKAEIQLRLLSMEVYRFESRRKSADSEDGTSDIEHERLSFSLQQWREEVEPILDDSSRPYDNAKQDVQTQLFRFFPHGAPFMGTPLASITVLLAEWHAICLLHMSKAPRAITAKTVAILGDMARHAEAICQIIEAALQLKTLPRGLVIMLHLALLVAVAYLSKSPMRFLWLRERFAWLESCGYIFSITSRARMAQVFEDNTIMHWWLPENQGFTPILRDVRAFADERNQSNRARQPEQLRAMKEIFEAVVDLHLQENPTTEHAAGV
ncbi:hypothetical protein BD289DRAFT_457598 [Coniella lustricola]|uniref:Zn(2)-C6 fungal-type domain-containing protein n=1 Tax=Coniella lustricola TaxID=2025994 RepID=A0A2T3ANR2_9PEZI|nr:hypothetical protein BD289DRAFT_457598 [Coniella lustricola]